MSNTQRDDIIRITGLSKRYAPGKMGDGKLALEDISLNIPRGSIYGLLGPNGAGKSTLINILAGLTTKSGGEITINGIHQDDHPQQTRYQLGVVPQEVVLDPFFTVRETLEYYAGYFGVKKSERQTDALLKALTLTDKATVNSRRLSGGMKRRVLIAKALVHRPPVLVLDEPTAGVDVELRRQLWDYVRELHAKGTTILLTTHYLEEAEELCDHLAIINRGKIIVDDRTETILQTMDRKQLNISVRETITAIPQELAAFEVEQTDAHSLSIYYQRGKTAVNEILQAIQRTGLTVQDVSTAEPDLEDIFRYLVEDKQAA